MDRTFSLRPHTGADIFRHIGDVAHRATVDAVAATNPVWAAILATNPTCSVATGEAIATTQPSVWAHAHLASDRRSTRLLAAVLDNADVTATVVWAAALWAHPQYTTAILDTLRRRNGQITDELAGVVADVVIANDVDLDTAALRTLISTASLAPAMRLAANYAAQLDIAELVTLVENYHDQMTVPACNRDIELLLHRRSDVFATLYDRRHQYGDVARSSLSMQVLSHTRQVSAEQTHDVVAWTEKADSAHAAKLLWALEETPRVPPGVLAQLHRRVELRHRRSWDSDRTETPRWTASARAEGNRDTTLCLVTPAQASTEDEFAAWARLAGDRRPGVCEALLENPLLPDLLRRRCQVNLRSYRETNGYGIQQLVHEAGLPYGFGVRLGLGLPTADEVDEVASAPARLTLNHVLAQVRGYKVGCRRHRAACTAFAAAMIFRHGDDLDAWQAAISLLDTLAGDTPVSSMIELVASV